MDRKREIADRVIARWKERGFVLDADPHYMRLVELWIEGEIGGPEMRQRYAQLLRHRADEGAGRVVAPTQQPTSIAFELAAGLDGSDEGSQRMYGEPSPRSGPPLESD
ncbi:hypothetical protein B5K05_33460 [Rhizobium phaseoli]|uniref:hypothetical protein n=1 Tax=Rhizobium phaseoli TaxID=396 RepID=UPI000E2E2980|nr:hypothetical protein B5K05_33460 [Rhizobium phaseoli]RDJ00855.1 hypothetical protein B5K04_30770 [Rhizobium phaseoli]